MSKKAFLVLLLLLFVVGCISNDSDEIVEVTQGPLPQVFVFPGPQEERLISREIIEQPNCNGTAETSQTVQRSHTVLYTLELASEITVKADGKAGIPGIGEVGVGTQVAAHYQVGYGQSETVGRSVTVAAAPNSHIEHIVQQFEVWETGEVLIVAGQINQRLPYNFRRDFRIKVADSANIGCPLDGHSISQDGSDGSLIVTQPSVPTPAPTPQIAPTTTAVSPQLINLVQNPGFENSMQGWEFSDDVSLISGFVGQTALQSAKTANTGWGWVGISQEIPVTPGQEYIFTAYLNWTNASQVHMKVDWYNDLRRETKGPHVMGGTDGTSGQWVQRGSSVIAPADARVARISIWHGMKNEQAVVGGVVQIDEVVFAEAP